MEGKKGKEDRMVTVRGGEGLSAEHLSGKLSP